MSCYRGRIKCISPITHSHYIAIYHTHEIEVDNLSQLKIHLTYSVRDRVTPYVHNLNMLYCAKSRTISVQ